MAFDDLPLQSCDYDGALDVTVVAGEVPRDLRGTLLRNGPGVLQLGESRLNFFDGLGMLVAVTFDRGEVRALARQVHTPLLDRERASGRLEKRRLFTNHPRRWKNFFDLAPGNSAQHDVYAWGGKVVAANDAGHVAMRAGTLEPIGDERWNRAVRRGHTMSPMPRVDLRNERLIGYSIAPGAISPDVATFYELDPSYKIVHSVETPLQRPATLVHDVAFTERFYVLLEFATRVDVPKALWGKQTFFEALGLRDDAKMTLLVVERATGRATRITVPDDTRTAFHIANAFERGGKLVVDATGYSAWLDFLVFGADRKGPPTNPPGKLVRYEIDVDRAEATARELATLCCELPEVDDAKHGLAHRYIYVATAASRGDEPDPSGFVWFHGVAKVDAESSAQVTWDAGRSAFCSQPAFVPREGAATEDDGYLLTFVLFGEERRSEVVVLDARRLETGPLARISLGRVLPGASHVHFDRTPPAIV